MDYCDCRPEPLAWSPGPRHWGPWSKPHLPTVGLALWDFGCVCGTPAGPLPV